MYLDANNYTAGFGSSRSIVRFERVIYISLPCNYSCLPTYRIFEAQWKEVFLLWLGRKHIFKQEKENFIDALVKFEDRCNGFYWEQAVLIAAEGIAEFKSSIYEIKIIEQLTLWAFGYFDFQKQQWLEALVPQG
jgi:hypothetical protein